MLQVIVYMYLRMHFVFVSMFCAYVCLTGVAHIYLRVLRVCTHLFTCMHTSIYVYASAHTLSVNAIEMYIMHLCVYGVLVRQPRSISMYAQVSDVAVGFDAVNGRGVWKQQTG